MKLNKVQKILAAVIVSICFMQAASADMDVLVLDGTHSVYGKGKLYFSAKAVRIDNQATGRLLISRAPDWKVAVFNSETHKYCVEESEVYAHQQYSSFFSLAFDTRREKPVSTGIHETVAGIPATKYVSYAVATGSTLAKKSQIQYWVAEKLGFPQALYSAFCNLSGLPKVPGLILRIKYTKDKGLDTLASKRAKLPDNFFEYPKGYIYAKNMQDVLFSVDSIKDMLSP